MVAFNSSRRQKPISPVLPASSPFEAVAAAACPDSAESAVGTHRTQGSVRIAADGQGEIKKVQIGRWRVLSAAADRRVVEVRELGCRRVAVRVERVTGNQGEPSSEVWQLYNLDGRLEAALQSTPDGRFAMLTNYRTRQACRMSADAQGQLRVVESWRI